MIVSEASTINVLLALALALASVVSYIISDATIWSITLEVSFTIVMCLQ